MTGFLIRWATNTVILIAVSLVVPGIHVEKWETGALAALVLGLFNAFLRPFIILLTLPLHILSLGFFTLIINALMFYLVSRVVEGFHVVNFTSAFWGALIFSILSFLLNLLINPQGKITVHFRSSSPRRPYRPPGPPPDDGVIDVEGRSDEGTDTDKRIPHK